MTRTPKIKLKAKRGSYKEAKSIQRKKKIKGTFVYR